jgi:hypothetical protein
VSVLILAAGGGQPQPPRRFPLTCSKLKKIEPRPGNSTAFERFRYWTPYGCWRTADDREILFNRDYTPIYERRRLKPPYFATRVANHEEWVEEIVATKHFFGSFDSPVAFGRRDSWQWRPAITRLNKVLYAWGLAELPPRPTPRSSAPSRLRRRIAAEVAAIKASMPPEPVMASAADWREIDKRKVSALSPRAIVNKHKIESGKLRNYIFFGEPKVGERSTVHSWMARCLLERGVPPSEAYVLLRITRWNKHRHENEFRWVTMTWAVIEDAWSKPFVPWSEQQKQKRGGKS